MKKTFELTAIDLYPEIMNIYGDRGNILYFRYRASIYGINLKIENISLENGFKIDNADIIFMGGGQDAEQALIYDDFIKNKKNILKEALDRHVIMLAVCGSYQLLCDYYKSLDGKIIEGISLFKGYTEAKSPRLIGNIAIKFNNTVAVGFENHGGRTYLEKAQKAFGTVLRGFGNNGEDKTEGARTDNFFGTYLHGSFLPKNFVFCDYLIDIALKNRYNASLDEVIKINRVKIDNSFEINARKDIKELRKF
ncbi:MAG: glutamine amidotransferase [Deltaproteobacteria bacterium]|jgi:CobQ-like glutamine amidotransferase family enzyme|nr:glutamine amidotransferase [Deltaproteobacteria bacterium]MCL5880912.1 glutamine amidotransferase [Deltaproteobacteria bacterium]MDA8303706.1 glutamine amidotransferase [Deltaproteobacteria bacterium]